MSKTYQLFCSHCNWKKITDGTDVSDLVEIPQSKIQLNIPSLDPKTNKTIGSKSISQKKKFKCPECGYAVSPKEIPNTQKILENKLNAEKEKLDFEETIKSALGIKDEKNKFNGS